MTMHTPLPTDPEALMELGYRTGSTSYAPQLILDHGKGMEVWDIQGKRYLDFLAGIAVNALGHCHPRVVEAVQTQAGQAMQISNAYMSRAQIRMQQLLVELSFGDRVFACNSGAEANESAIKLARRYQRVVRGDTNRTEIISFNHSFHGRTLAAITATGQPKYHVGFEPLPPGFLYAEYNDLASVEALIGPRTTAVLVEPIQGEGGIRPAAPGFLEGLRELCDKHGALLIFDEVQTGVGRTGHLFAYQHYGVTPDLMTLAKGLGGGVPVGALVSTDEIFKGFVKGSHATTFGGNPLASAAAVAVLEVVSEPSFLAHVRAMGEYLVGKLNSLSGPLAPREVRGVGLMIGAEVGPKALAIMGAGRDLGLLFNTAGADTLRFVPPLIVQPDDIDACALIVQQALDVVAARP